MKGFLETPGPRDRERRELLERRERLEDEMACAIPSGGVERELDVTGGQPTESILSDHRTERIAGGHVAVDAGFDVKYPCVTFIAPAARSRPYRTARRLADR